MASVCLGVSPCSTCGFDNAPGVQRNHRHTEATEINLRMRFHTTNACCELFFELPNIESNSRPMASYIHAPFFIICFQSRAGQVLPVAKPAGENPSIDCPEHVRTLVFLQRKEN